MARAVPGENRQKLIDLATQQAWLRSRDLKAHGIPRAYLTQLVQDGILEKFDRGLYRPVEAPMSEQETLASVARRVPRGFFCLLTALQFHDIGTQLPRQVWIAMPRGSHAPRLAYPPLTMVQLAPALMNVGIEEHLCDGTPIRISGVARTLVDCFRFRHRIGLDVALEALRDARAYRRYQIDELWEYARRCRVTAVIRPYLEILE